MGFWLGLDYLEFNLETESVKEGGKSGCVKNTAQDGIRALIQSTKPEMETSSVRGSFAIWLLKDS